MKTKDFPEIAILVITYNRYDSLKATLDALQANVIYPADKLHIIVSDDSTGGNYLTHLRKVKAYKEWGKGMKAIEMPERSGWGKHVNFALTHIYQNMPNVQYVFQIEDDYILTRQLDLQVGVALLENKPDIGMLRYRGTAGMHAIFHQFEADISNYLPDYDESSGQIQGRLCYLQMDSGSQSLWIYSNGAHLKRLRGENNFHEFYGQYPEGLKLGDTEEMYAHIVKDKMTQANAPAITILPEFVTMKFQHIGHTWKGSEHDI